MDLTIIGSGTLRPSPVRASASHLLEAEDLILLMDVGPGSVHGLARHGKPWWDVTHLVLSHYHTDHLGDLPHLLFALKWAAPQPRSHPLRILGPPGLEERVNHLAGAYGDFIREQEFPLEYVELPRDGSWEDPDVPELAVAFCPTPHTPESVAMRIRTGKGVVGYTGDTGPDPEVGRFLQGCDALVCECALPDPPPFDNHLSPSGVAELATNASPGLVILTHVYPPQKPQEVPLQVARAGYSGAVLCGEDGMSVTLP